MMQRQYGLVLAFLTVIGLSMAFSICKAESRGSDGAAALSGQYRNLFKEIGKSDAAITEKVNRVWEQLFYGDDYSERIYYEVGSDMAYIKDIGNGDIRTEGMSYGMMICVQLNKQAEFNKLWKWAKTYMYYSSGDLAKRAQTS
ncbi:MAG TPA: glycosyl hydrolase family 8 [Bacillota bacterium]|nr:glycosyl hydrolase family 8 [Bacillota bacterium]